MGCCTRSCAAEMQFGVERAERDLQSYRRRGVKGITQVLLTELRRRPLRGKELLDIGGGIGIIGFEVAGANIASATLVEASPAYLEVARREVERRSLPHRTNFILGDFTLVAETVPQADIVTLDRVVCCYPDAEALLKAAARRTRQLLAFTYPRDRWYVHLITSFENLMRRIRGTAFRTTIHSPHRMSSALENAGFVRDSSCGTSVWMVDIYRKEQGDNAI